MQKSTNLVNELAALGGGMLTVLVLAVGKVEGGWTTVWDVGMKYDKFAMFRSYSKTTELATVVNCKEVIHVAK